MKAQADLFSELSVLRKQSRTDEALQLLQKALRNSELLPEELEHAGRFLRKYRQRRERDVRVWLLGQCTTQWLAHVLEAVSFGRGVELSIEQGEFDNVMQHVSAAGPTRDASDILILLPWNQRLLQRRERDSASCIDDEVSFWRETWRLARERGIGKIIQVGYDWVLPGAHGQHLSGREGGDVATVRQVNAALRQALPTDIYFLDLELISGLTGRQSFYDPRQYFWTKQPFSQVGLVELAQHLSAGIRACTSGSKKILVLDLDHTLWGGVVGELGPSAVRCGDGPDGEAFQSFQDHLKALAARGVLLAVASKNNPTDAREPFETNSNMVLAMNDFAAFEACWEPKATMLRRIAESVGLGLDSFVFFDDNTAEREHIRQALPEVEVVEVPEDPAEYTRALQRGNWFESIALTAEDTLRSEQYAVARRRTEAQADFSTIEAYLTSLDMRALVKPLDDSDLARVLQLIGKTNQFNLTTRRHSETQVRQMAAAPNSVCFSVRMKDRFGDHGLVACVLAVPLSSAELRIDTWLMSCRVIGRTLEQRTFLSLAERAASLGYRTLVGEFIASAKNQQVAQLYPQLGFQAVPRSADGSHRYRIELPLAQPITTFVTVEDA